MGETFETGWGTVGKAIHCVVNASAPILIVKLQSSFDFFFKQNVLLLKCPIENSFLQSVILYLCAPSPTS